MPDSNQLFADLLIQVAKSFPNDVQRLVREMAKLPAFATVQGRVCDLLLDNCPSERFKIPPDYPKLQEALIDVRSTIE